MNTHPVICRVAHSKATLFPILENNEASSACVDLLVGPV